MPVPLLNLPERPIPPLIINAPDVEDVELTFDSIETAPTSVEVD
jgi:hypothetical protein